MELRSLNGVGPQVHMHTCRDAEDQSQRSEEKEDVQGPALE